MIPPRMATPYSQFGAPQAGASGQPPVAGQAPMAVPAPGMPAGGAVPAPGMPAGGVPSSMPGVVNPGGFIKVPMGLPPHSFGVGGAPAPGMGQRIPGVGQPMPYTTMPVGGVGMAPPPVPGMGGAGRNPLAAGPGILPYQRPPHPMDAIMGGAGGMDAPLSPSDMPPKKRIKADGDEALDAGKLMVEDDSPKFQMLLRASEDRSTINVAWYYPAANPRDDSAWIGLYHADRWQGVKLPCPRPDLAGRIGYKYISQNASSGEVAFPISQKTSMTNGHYIFALHGHQDVTVALSCTFTIFNHSIASISTSGAASSSFATMGGTRRGRNPDMTSQPAMEPAVMALMQAMKGDEGGAGMFPDSLGGIHPIKPEVRGPPKPKKGGQSTSFSDERPAMEASRKAAARGGLVDLPGDGIEWKDGTRRCGAIGARGPCGRRWGTCPYHPLNGAGTAHAFPTKQPNPQRKRKKEDDGLPRRTEKSDVMAPISLTPEIMGDAGELSPEPSPGDHDSSGILSTVMNLNPRRRSGGESHPPPPEDGGADGEWAAFTPPSAPIMPRAPRPPMLELPTAVTDADPLADNAAPPQTPGQTASKQRTELHNLVLEGNSERIKVLIDGYTGPGKQAILDAQEEHGYTPLIDASSLEEEEKALEIVGLLIDKGVTLALKDKQGYTAVHWAAACGHNKALKLLLDAKSDVDAQCDFGETALHRAARLGFVECVQTLVEAGSNVFQNNYVFETPLEVAGVWGNKVKIKQRQEVRKVLYESQKSARTLILHHADFLDHITREGHQESPARMTSILGALKKNTGPACVFEDFELQLDDNFEPATIEDIARAHARSYIELVDSIHESLSSEAQTPVPFTPLVQKSLRVPVAELKTNEFSDTSFSHGSRRAAMRGAGAVIHAIDKVMAGDARNAFCLVRPPGHHAGVHGLIDGAVSCGFCIFNSVAIGALHAHTKYVPSPI